MMLQIEKSSQVYIKMYTTAAEMIYFVQLAQSQCGGMVRDILKKKKIKK